LRQKQIEKGSGDWWGKVRNPTKTGKRRLIRNQKTKKKNGGSGTIQKFQKKKLTARSLQPYPIPRLLGGGQGCGTTPGEKGKEGSLLLGGTLEKVHSGATSGGGETVGGRRICFQSWVL